MTTLEYHQTGTAYSLRNLNFSETGFAQAVRGLHKIRIDLKEYRGGFRMVWTYIPGVIEGDVV